MLLKETVINVKLALNHVQFFCVIHSELRRHGVYGHIMYTKNIINV